MYDRIDQGRIYDLIYTIEGIKEPVYHYPALTEAASDILSFMHENGISAELQEFMLQGKSYINVVGWIDPVGNCGDKDGTDPSVCCNEAVITHYDTQINLFGLNDGAVKTGIMVEVARLLKENPPSDRRIWFVAACLGENSAPDIREIEYEKLFTNNIWNRKTLFTSWANTKAYEGIWGRAQQLAFAGKTYGEALRLALSEYPAVPEAVADYFAAMVGVYGDLTCSGAAGRLNQIGAVKWIEHMKNRGIAIDRFYLMDDDFALIKGSEGVYQKPAYTHRHEMRCQMVDQLDFDMLGHWDPAQGEFVPNDREEDRGMIGRTALELLTSLSSGSDTEAAK
jgi:hypothetical protein